MKMAKVAAFQKDLFNFYREEMLDESIEWAFCRETGVTVIYQVMPKGNFVKLSVAYCNANDTFKKKIGLFTAMERWHINMAIQIPTFGNPASETIAAFIAMVSIGDSRQWDMLSISN
jgi:hypothetical protein